MSFEIDKSGHKTAQKKAKMRNLAIKNPSKNEGDVAHKKAGGPKLVGEGISFSGWRKKASDSMKKTAKKKHDYGRDAGAEAAKIMKKKDHAKVNFLDPDD